MKFFIIFLLASLYLGAFGQNRFPMFLKGHWNVVGTDNYEQWDVVSNESVKGFGYKILNDSLVISEYLDIVVRNGKPVLIATVIGQNGGKPIEFIGNFNEDNNQMKFENYNHDFPQEITYTYAEDTIETINVRIAGRGKEKYIKLIRLKNSDIQLLDNYDKNLADKLSADEYGMKSYFFVILKTGPINNDNKEFVNNAFKGHMNNIDRLVKEEKLIVAGPFAKNNDENRGLFILDNVKTEEEAKQILETDPAIKAGLLTYKLYTWYGSAALRMYLPFSKKITKTKFQ